MLGGEYQSPLLTNMSPNPLSHLIIIVCEYLRRVEMSEAGNPPDYRLRGDVTQQPPSLA